MMNRYGFLVVLLSVAFTFALHVISNLAYANENDVVTSKSEEMAQVNTFELFWPVVAGKTSNESLYFLKRYKEDIRGFFIFGKPQKAEYNTLLATKRILEADKLMQDGINNEYKKTLEAALYNLNEADKISSAVVSSSTPFGLSGAGMQNKLANLARYLDFKLNDSNYDRDLGIKLLEKIKSIQGKIK